jgi:hypothetical protein
VKAGMIMQEDLLSSTIRQSIWCRQVSIFEDIRVRFSADLTVEGIPPIFQMYE